MINAVPPRYKAADLNIAPNAKCALCKTIDTSQDRRWVVCPLVNGQAICYGCCLDYQGLARTLEFEDDPFRDLFDSLAHKTGESVATLRLKCLEHQQEIVSERLRNPVLGEDRDELLNLAFHISEAAREVTS